MADDVDCRRIFVMEISPAYVNVAIERWRSDAGYAAIPDGDGRIFAQVKAERLADGVGSPPDTSGADADPEPARKRK